jgi:flavodoxin
LSSMAHFLGVGQGDAIQIWSCLSVSKLRLGGIMSSKNDSGALTHMLDVKMICFSQTGNTLKVAEVMSDAFRESGNSARVIDLKKATAEDAVNCDVLGVGAPCFASQAPTPVKKFLGTWPSLYGKKAFVFATSGGAPGRVLYDMGSLLRAKGANVLGGFLARGSVSYPLPCLIGRFPSRPGAEDLDRARHFARSVVEHVTAARSGPLSESRRDALEPGRGLYDFMAFINTDSFVRRTIPKPKIDPDRCNECMLCVDECPMDNITMSCDVNSGHQTYHAATGSA